jgi:hypothetical protein
MEKSEAFRKLVFLVQPGEAYRAAFDPKPLPKAPTDGERDRHIAEGRRKMVNEALRSLVREGTVQCFTDAGIEFLRLTVEPSPETSAAADAARDDFNRIVRQLMMMMPPESMPGLDWLLKVDRSRLLTLATDLLRVARALSEPSAEPPETPSQQGQ